MRLFQRLHLIPATLLCFFCACNGSAATQRESPSVPPAKEENFSSDLFFEEEQQPEESTENVYWNVDAIDISDVDPSRKLIAFTFDDAPARTMENILAVFASFNEKNEDCRASATVFFNGALFNAETPHLLYTACALGFELGNHTYSHLDLTSLSKETLTEEIDKTDALLEKIDGQKRHLLRAPFGKTNELVKECAKTPLIDWTIDTLDWTKISEEEIYNTVFNHRFSGAIVLMHDGYEHTVSALKRLLPDLKKDGYQVVSVSKMIKAHGCKFRRGGVYIRARKQN